MRELPAVIGTQAQWVVLCSVGSEKVGHHGAVWSEIGPHQVNRVTRFDAGRGNIDQGFGWRAWHRFSNLEFNMVQSMDHIEF